MLIHRYKPTDLFLNGDIAFGAEEQLENQAKMAVRLANFISAFLQVRVPNPRPFDLSAHKANTSITNIKFSKF